MLKVVYHSQFKKDYKLIQKNKYDITLLTDVIEKLAKEEKLEAKYHDHALQGEYKGCRECHIQPDWLLIYEINKRELILYLTRTGTHSNLYK